MRNQNFERSRQSCWRKGRSLIWRDRKILNWAELSVVTLILRFFRISSGAIKQKIKMQIFPLPDF